MNEARLWARRAILSALAGGGLTALGLGAQITGSALAAEAPSGTSGPSGSRSGVGPGGSQTTTEAATTPTTTVPAAATGSTTQPTTTTPAAATTPANPAQGEAGSELTPSASGPHVVAQRQQRASQAPPSQTSVGTLAPKPSALKGKLPQTTSSANIAPAPQLAANAPGAMALLPALSDSFSRALSFYRIPLFLLPIYKAAAAQYGVPWEILAAINEVETDYGADLSVSTAGAVGWMQFMPETWLQYGVDALGAGYADPYNPVDAVFAAARYLRAAGAGAHLRTAIFAYNHSDAYVQSVLLRARLIASYPDSVISTLTGLTEGSLPVTGAQVSTNAPLPANAGSPLGVSSATVGVSARAASQRHASTAMAASPAGSSLPGSIPAPSPEASGARVEAKLNAPAAPGQLTTLTAPRNAPIVAVEDGRIVALGDSRKLGNYLVLQDTYGDVFTYAGLGSIAPYYRLAKPSQLSVPKGALDGGEASREATPKLPATGGRQLALTLHVAKKVGPQSSAAGDPSTPSGAQGRRSGLPSAPVGLGKVRVFAHPGNPDAQAAARARAAAVRAAALASGWSLLRQGSLVSQGTVLGRLSSFGETPSAYLRFAIRPAGDESVIDPQPILENWRQLDAALHPKGAKTGSVLAGATASDAFKLSASELEHAVLADPGIVIGACDRQQIAAGKVDSRALAILVFLSRSGLEPTVGRLRCGRSAYTAQGVVSAYYPGDTIDLTAVNGIPISGHQGQGTITDIAIRALLTIELRFAPKRILSLMKYPNAPSTIAKPDHGEYVEIDLGPRPASTVALAASVGARGIPARHTSLDSRLSGLEWQRLMRRIASLSQPRVSRTPSSAAIHVSGH